MPPAHKNKEYCVRFECPLPKDITIETFVRGIRQQSFICSYLNFVTYTKILEKNGYVCVSVEDTANFRRD